MTLPAETTPAIEKKTPHLLKYMGSKREILEFIVDSAKSLNVNSEWFCDLFAGSGVVSGAFKNDFKVHANDIQAYSKVLSSTYLMNFNKNINIQDLIEIRDKVEILVNQFKNKYPNLNYQYKDEITIGEFSAIENSQQNLIEQDFNIGFHLFVKYYSGTYWSFDQCIWIDSIRAIAEQYANKPHYYAILSSLIFSMSYVSQSTGHYAQYRDATSESSLADILIYRKREIWPYFERKFLELMANLNSDPKDFRATTLDYIDCLRIINNNTLVYADPPYQSVHYSRFYHAIETLIKYDYPKVQFKGRYREDRHQSPFCKKTTVRKAFEMLFEGIDYKKSHLILSYSDTGMISIQDIKDIYNKYLSKKYLFSSFEKDHTHSKMGRNDIKDQDVTEHILLLKRI